MAKAKPDPGPAPDDKKPGRPPGARNVPTDVVMELPPSCPRCGRVGPHEYVRTTKTLHHEGIIGDGARYNVVIFRIRKCQCGQQLSVRTYEWREQPA